MGNLREKLTPANIIALIILVAAVVVTILGLRMDFFSYTVKSGSESTSIYYKLSGISSEEGEYSGWSQLSNFSITRLAAYATMGLSIATLVVFALNLFVDKGILYILTSLCSALLAICGILTIVFVWFLFGTNAEASMTFNGVEMSTSFGCAIGSWLVGIGGFLGGAICSSINASAYKKYKS